MVNPHGTEDVPSAKPVRPGVLWAWGGNSTSFPEADGRHDGSRCPGHSGGLHASQPPQQGTRERGDCSHEIPPEIRPGETVFTAGTDQPGPLRGVPHHESHSLPERGGKNGPRRYGGGSPPRQVRGRAEGGNPALPEQKAPGAVGTHFRRGGGIAQRLLQPCGSRRVLAVGVLSGLQAGCAA